MAKVGEGDPRWIVNNRKDGQNVGGWHWSEHDVTPWAKENLKGALKGLVLFDEPGVGKCEVTGTTDYEGDATVNNRKGKTMFLYDLSITAKFTASHGTLEGVKGKLQLSDIEQQNEPEEFECRVQLDGAEGPEHQVLKEVIRKQGVPVVRKAVGEFVRRLQARAVEVNTSAKRAAEAKSQGGEGGAAGGKVKLPEIGGGSGQGGEAAKASSGGKGKAKDGAKSGAVSVEWKFRCRAEDVFACLTDPPRAKAWTGTAATDCGKEPGRPFNYYGGAITGTVRECAEPTRLVQDWRLATWPEGCVSRVELTFHWDGDASETTAKLTQTGVPAGEEGVTKEGWEKRVFQRIKSTFGY